MSALVHQRCLNHPGREAVVRCPECSHFFCRECVTEHERRMVCANCLAASAVEAPAPRRRWPTAFTALLQAAAGFVVLWFLFYGTGRLLLAMPSSFHEGTVWEELVEELEQ